MYRKNTASQYVYFCLVNATTGAALTGATVTAYRSLDAGTQVSATGTTTELANGQYRFNLSQADTNGDYGSYLFTASNAVPVEKTVVFTQANPQDSVSFGLSRLDATVSSRMTSYTQPTGFLSADFTRLDASVSSRMATYTQPIGFLAATFPTTVASPTNITSATGVVLASTTHTGAVIPTVTNVTNGVTASTVNDKTGYSLVAGTGLGNQTANITGNLSGSVNSVTTRVTANTDQWNGVAVTGMPMPTFTLPANFSALSITSGGYVIVSGDAFGNTFLIPNLASQSSVNTLTTYVDTEVAAIKAKTDNLPASPAAVGDIPTTSAIATAVAATQALSRLDSMIESNGASQFRFDTIALELAPTGSGGSGATDWTIDERASIRSILGIPGSGTTPADPTVGILDTIRDNVGTLAGYVDTEVAAIKAKTDNLPANPSAISDIPTASEIAAAVAEEPLAGHTTAGTLGKVLFDAGSGVSTLLTRITSSVATMFGDLIAMIQGSGIAPKWTASALSLAPTSTGSVTATVAVPQILAHTAYNTDEIIVYRGTFWSFQITNLGDLTNLDKIWFTLRKRQNDSDSKSIIQIEQTAGLLVSNGATATNPSHGTLTVNVSTITITVNQQVTQYCEVTNNLNYDIKALTTGGQVRMLTISDQFIVENDVTRRIS